MTFFPGITPALSELTADLSEGSVTRVFLVVHDDAVKAEVLWEGRRESIGWFVDEICAIEAAFEFGLLQSALSPELRRLRSEVVVECAYCHDCTHHAVCKFKRGTTIRQGPLGRRVVRLPGSLDKPWLR